jgi:hypothetical protein
VVAARLTSERTGSVITYFKTFKSSGSISIASITVDVFESERKYDMIYLTAIG